ncbi:DUF1492 domain-containing protein [Lachnospiraceae bacterium ZAX-1]
MEDLKDIKKYLKRAYYLDREINSRLVELAEMRAMSTALGSLDYAKDRVQESTGSDRMGDTIAKIVDYEQKINAEIDRFVDLKTEIRRLIQSVDNDEHRIILSERYLNFKRWDRIADDMGRSCQWAHILHKKALDEINKKLSFT